MKIIIRIPTETYAYAEVHYDSIEEYKKQHPEFAKAYMEVRAEARKAATPQANYNKEEHPFD
jgi:hypothetical protein